MDEFDLGQILGKVVQRLDTMEKRQKKMCTKVDRMDLTITNHRLVIGGITLVSTSTLVVIWELSKEWIKLKVKAIVGS